jgi:tetratricopeptide (TPR) repeat protein
VKNEAYGAMYNKYNVMLYTDENLNLDEAIAIAKIEVEHRPTPQSYDLLAWSYFNNGNIDDALKIVNNHIIGHTFEPMALYHSAEIYKAAGEDEKANAIKKDLAESSYELGPLVAKKIEKL